MVLRIIEHRNQLARNKIQNFLLNNPQRDGQGNILYQKNAYFVSHDEGVIDSRINKTNQAIANWLEWIFYGLDADDNNHGVPAGVKDLAWLDREMQHIKSDGSRTLIESQEAENAIRNLSQLLNNLGSEEEIKEQLLIIFSDPILTRNAIGRINILLENEADEFDLALHNLIVNKNYQDFNAIDLYCMWNFVNDFHVDFRSIPGEVIAQLFNNDNHFSNDWTNNNVNPGQFYNESGPHSSYRRMFAEAIIGDHWKVRDGDSHLIISRELNDDQNSLWNIIANVWEELALMSNIVQQRNESLNLRGIERNEESMTNWFLNKLILTNPATGNIPNNRTQWWVDFGSERNRNNRNRLGDAKIRQVFVETFKFQSSAEGSKIQRSRPADGVVAQYLNRGVSGAVAGLMYNLSIDANRISDGNLNGQPLAVGWIEYNGNTYDLDNVVQLNNLVREVCLINNPSNDGNWNNPLSNDEQSILINLNGGGNVNAEAIYQAALLIARLRKIKTDAENQVLDDWLGVGNDGLIENKISALNLGALEANQLVNFFREFFDARGNVATPNPKQLAWDQINDLGVNGMAGKVLNSLNRLVARQSYRNVMAGAVAGFRQQALETPRDNAIMDGFFALTTVGGGAIQDINLTADNARKLWNNNWDWNDIQNDGHGNIRVVNPSDRTNVDGYNNIIALGDKNAIRLNAAKSNALIRSDSDALTLAPGATAWNPLLDPREINLINSANDLNGVNNARDLIIQTRNAWTTFFANPNGSGTAIVDAGAQSNWMNSGLLPTRTIGNDSQADKAYNNGWVNFANYNIINKKIPSYTNPHGKRFTDIDPTRMQKINIDNQRLDSIDSMREWAKINDVQGKPWNPVLTEKERGIFDSQLLINSKDIQAAQRLLELVREAMKLTKFEKDKLDSLILEKKGNTATFKAVNSNDNRVDKAIIHLQELERKEKLEFLPPSTNNDKTNVDTVSVSPSKEKENKEIDKLNPPASTSDNSEDIQETKELEKNIEKALESKAWGNDQKTILAYLEKKQNSELKSETHSRVIEAIVHLSNLKSNHQNSSHNQVVPEISKNQQFAAKKATSWKVVGLIVIAALFILASIIYLLGSKKPNNKSKN